MSYKYGINGNDLNWEAIEFLNTYCPICIEHYNNITLKGDDMYDLLDDDCTNDEPYHEEIMCEGHILYYTRLEESQFLNAYSGTIPLKDDEWVIKHDTNDNFIRLVGNVPDEYLTEQYIQERDNANKE
jgi:hypothetical protein